MLYRLLKLNQIPESKKLSRILFTIWFLKYLIGFGRWRRLFIFAIFNRRSAGWRNILMVGSGAN